MQDLKALEGKSLAELREIGKALGIPLLMMKKKDLIEKILNFTQDGGVADTETQQSPAEAPKKTRRPRIAKTESAQASVEIREQPAAQTTTTPTPAATKESGKRRGRPPRKVQAALSVAATDIPQTELIKIPGKKNPSGKYTKNNRRFPQHVRQRRSLPKTILREKSPVKVFWR